MDRTSARAQRKAAKAKRRNARQAEWQNREASRRQSRLDTTLFWVESGDGLSARAARMSETRHVQPPKNATPRGRWVLRKSLNVADVLLDSSGCAFQIIHLPADLSEPPQLRRCTSIEVTDTHLFWSLDRQDWIPAGQLRPGEQTAGINGPASVTSVERIGYAPAVYNLEVHGQHVYRVGAPGVLVHNADDEYGIAQQVQSPPSAKPMTPRGLIDKLTASEREQLGKAYIEFYQAAFANAAPNTHVVTLDINDATEAIIKSLDLSRMNRVEREAFGELVREDLNTAANNVTSYLLQPAEVRSVIQPPGIQGSPWGIFGRPALQNGLQYNWNREFVASHNRWEPSGANKMLQDVLDSAPPEIQRRWAGLNGRLGLNEQFEAETKRLADIADLAPTRYEGFRLKEGLFADIPDERGFVANTLIPQYREQTKKLEQLLYTQLEFIQAIDEGRFVELMPHEKAYAAEFKRQLANDVWVTRSLIWMLMGRERAAKDWLAGKLDTAKAVTNDPQRENLAFEAVLSLEPRKNQDLLGKLGEDYMKIVQDLTTVVSLASLIPGSKGFIPGPRPSLQGPRPSQPAPSNVVNPGKLVFDSATQSWRSPAGLVYGQGSAQGNRVLHVLEHLTPNPAKATHSVFNVPRNKLIELIDQAWLKKGASVPGDPGAYIVNMGKVIGTAGETQIKIIVKPGTSDIITAYPFK